jgi:erythronate-4-phosphate dehydrogenase
MYNLIVDENIAFANKAFNQFGNVTLLPGREITNSILKNADILIVRSITTVDERLLKNTSIIFVATATIGTDHIDLDYLKKNNIVFADAKGCNAVSVAEYVAAVLLKFSVRFNFELKNKSIGIIGVGNVGSKVADFSEALGLNVLLNDPPLKRSGDKRSFVSLDEILSADIITLHTPLNLNGIDKTFHLFNKNLFNKIKDGAILINSSRGAVINNKELLDAISSKKLKVALDVWENEPEVDLDLLNHASIATPHIAGYSLEGKINGTKIIYNSLCEFLGLQNTFSFQVDQPVEKLKQFNRGDKLEISLEKLISSIYSVEDDDNRMRRMLMMDKNEASKSFDLQRKNYPIRREFSNYTISANNLSVETQIILKKLGFNVIT